jgi:diaminopimelate epimerase
VSMGNPHAVLFDSPFSAQEVDEIGPIVSAGQPEGANVEFVRQIAPTVLEVIVWERGVGRTMACGTGAGAVVVAAARRGLVPFDTAVMVMLPGGGLEVTVESETLHVTKRALVHHVFSGDALTA